MRPFVIVDVGARWGVSEQWAALRPQLRVFGFDPDAEECDRLNTMARAEGDPYVTYVPVALAGTTAEVPFYATTDPACASLYRPIPEVVGTFVETQCMVETGHGTVAVTTLDAWCAEQGLTYVDAMKLDTQGSELGVLQGATALLDTVQLLEIEVEFNPMYEGQPLFGDVDAFLRDHGFLLWRLDNLVHYSTGSSGEVPMESLAYYDSVPFTAPARGGQLYWGHATYTRAELCPGFRRAAGEEQRDRSAALLSAAGLPDLAAFLRER